MAGTWVLIVEFLIAVIFLARSRIVRQGVRRIRKTVGLGLICLTLLLSPLAEWVYSKGSSPTRSPSQSQTLVLPVPSPSSLTSSTNSSFIPQRSALTSGMPAWWNDNDTDSDSDGIPDLWEKWTHGNRYVEDSAIDRDDDGLTDLEEFQNQTDPRTADTDGDGFSDAFEVANGLNPTTPEDFTPIEPDVDNNGRIDLWENAPYYYGFTDTDHDGFDDYYESEVLETASDENFDVVVTVYTTRSAVLTWDNGISGIVVLPTTGQSIRLRLPFGVDSTLNLLPSPEGTDPPAGELWKSRMRFAFSPRSGQNLYGNALVSPDGMIAHKVVNQESAIEFFAPLSPTVGFQTMSLTGGGAVGPSTDIKAGKFEVNHIDKYHGLYDGVGAFTVTNHLGMGDAVYDWSSAFGDMDPESGTESWLSVDRLPDYDEEMTVVTATDLDSESRVAVTSIVMKCSQRVFSASLSTNNFSPHLGETLGVGVTLPECEHVQTPGWLEIEVMRDIIGATQHVASVDMDVSTSTMDRYLDTTALGGQSLSFVWDGSAQVGLPLAEHPDLFTNSVVHFHRAMPAITSGEPVPPPFYTLIVRMYNTEKTTILHQVSWTIYVPQVVNLMFSDEIAAQLMRPILYANPTNGNGSTTLLSGCSLSEAQAALASLTGIIRSSYPSGMNLRVVYNSEIFGECKTLVLSSASSNSNKRGQASDVVSRNHDPTGVVFLFLDSFANTFINKYKWMIKGGNDSYSVPLTPNQYARHIGCSAAHELGHLLGLVDKEYWDVELEKSGVRCHNKNGDRAHMMDAGGIYRMRHRLQVDTVDFWRETNSDYLRFILPNGD